MTQRTAAAGLGAVLLLVAPRCALGAEPSESTSAALKEDKGAQTAEAIGKIFAGYEEALQEIPDGKTKASEAAASAKKAGELRDVLQSPDASYAERRKAQLALPSLALRAQEAAADQVKLAESGSKRQRDLASNATKKAAELRATARAVAASANAPAPQPSSPGDVTFVDGGTLRYGPTVSLLRFTTTRPANEPGRLRNYTPALDVLPAQFGFQFIYRPPARPWRLWLADHKTYQLLSAGGVLLAHVDTGQASRGSLSLAGTLGIFDDAIGLGAGFDLYRGIAVRGADENAGSGTVYTGFLAWAFAKQGELTPENAFVVVTLNLEWLTKSVAGKL